MLTGLTRYAGVPSSSTKGPYAQWPGRRGWGRHPTAPDADPVFHLSSGNSLMQLAALQGVVGVDVSEPVTMSSSSFFWVATPLAWHCSFVRASILLHGSFFHICSCNAHEQTTVPRQADALRCTPDITTPSIPIELEDMTYVIEDHPEQYIGQDGG